MRKKFFECRYFLLAPATLKQFHYHNSAQTNLFGAQILEPGERQRITPEYVNHDIGVDEPHFSRVPALSLSLRANSDESVISERSLHMPTSGE